MCSYAMDVKTAAQTSRRKSRARDVQYKGRWKRSRRRHNSQHSLQLSVSWLVIATILSCTHSFSIHICNRINNRCLNFASFKNLHSNSLSTAVSKSRCLELCLQLLLAASLSSSLLLLSILKFFLVRWRLVVHTQCSVETDLLPTAGLLAANGCLLDKHGMSTLSLLIQTHILTTNRNANLPVIRQSCGNLGWGDNNSNDEVNAIRDAIVQESSSSGVPKVIQSRFSLSFRVVR